MTHNQSIIRYDIQALIDNELSWEEEKGVRDFMKSDRDAAQYYEVIRIQKENLKKWWLRQK